MTAQDRGRVLFRLAEKVRKEAAHLAELESRNGGKPIVEAEFDINDVATCFEYYGGLGPKKQGERNTVPHNTPRPSLPQAPRLGGAALPGEHSPIVGAWE